MANKNPIDYGRYNQSDKISKFTKVAKQNRANMKRVLTLNGVKYKDTDPTNTLFKKYIKITQK